MRGDCHLCWLWPILFPAACKVSAHLHIVCLATEKVEILTLAGTLTDCSRKQNNGSDNHAHERNNQWLEPGFMPLQWSWPKLIHYYPADMDYRRELLSGTHKLQCFVECHLQRSCFS